MAPANVLKTQEGGSVKRTLYAVARSSGFCHVPLTWPTPKQKPLHRALHPIGEGDVIESYTERLRASSVLIDTIYLH